MHATPLEWLMGLVTVLLCIFPLSSIFSHICCSARALSFEITGVYISCVAAGKTHLSYMILEA